MFCLQAYPVEEILTNFSKNNRAAKRAAIVSKLKKGHYYSRDERVIVMKILGKFLISNCAA